MGLLLLKCQSCQVVQRMGTLRKQHWPIQKRRFDGGLIQPEISVTQFLSQKEDGLCWRSHRPRLVRQPQFFPIQGIFSCLGAASYSYVYWFNFQGCSGTRHAQKALRFKNENWLGKAVTFNVFIRNILRRFHEHKTRSHCYRWNRHKT